MRRIGTTSSDHGPVLVPVRWLRLGRVGAVLRPGRGGAGVGPGETSAGEPARLRPWRGARCRASAWCGGRNLKARARVELPPSQILSPVAHLARPEFRATTASRREDPSECSDGWIRTWQRLWKGGLMNSESAGLSTTASRADTAPGDVSSRSTARRTRRTSPPESRTTSARTPSSPTAGKVSRGTPQAHRRQLPFRSAEKPAGQHAAPATPDGSLSGKGRPRRGTLCPPLKRRKEEEWREVPLPEFFAAYADRFPVLDQQGGMTCPGLVRNSRDVPSSDWGSAMTRRTTSAVKGRPCP